MAKHIIPEKESNKSRFSCTVNTPAKVCSNAYLKLKGSVVCACASDGIKSPSLSLLFLLFFSRGNQHPLPPPLALDVEVLDKNWTEIKGSNLNN